jgi:putative membrane protein
MSKVPAETRAGRDEVSAGHAPDDDTIGDPGGQSARIRRWLAARRGTERGLGEIGQEPDPRFTFANERTFLAWNRTALALIAAGLGAAQFLHFHPNWLRLLIAVPLIVLGAGLALASYLHWGDSERAMRLREPLGYSWMPRVLTGGIVVIALCGGIVAIVEKLVH